MHLTQQAARAEGTPNEPGAQELGYCFYFGSQGPPARLKSDRTARTPRGTQQKTRASRPRTVYIAAAV